MDRHCEWIENGQNRSSKWNENTVRPVYLYTLMQPKGFSNMLLANIYNLLLTFNQYVTSSILSLFYKQNLKITFGLNTDSYLFFLSWPSLSYFGHTTEKEMKAGNFQLVLTPLTLLIVRGWLFLVKRDSAVLVTNKTQLFFLSYICSFLIFSSSIMRTKFLFASFVFCMYFVNFLAA